ncbi:formate dehydrogenase iron-sulfur subunit [Desulfacinum infernum DSM 9756]|uniref:Formate dehydrogenase iron-sulfur subunit n=1 Tax=Desulfacinum infernum DSM 9756 TaxID=1121391 RepID=A0A1M4XXZ9_9BACT|nr:4Fe-4S dicluster domain-containing protein [Desulfacinum infernum]SHE98484.1 formate dehydrogenase iron-sulfur subunit [Desulfacinum infernum DSM 9756]
MAKAFLIDTSRCTACRGCQVACKEWHGLPANRTRQRGSHQNPPDLNAYNYKVVRFHEDLKGGNIRWFFFPDQCRHCVDPPCKAEAEGYVEGAVVRDEATGAVVFTLLTAKLSPQACEAVRSACPYDIPRRDEKTGRLTKCDMCIDRVAAGMAPACVKACPTGAMNFGERSEMLKLGERRLAQAKKVYPEAALVDADTVHTVFLVPDPRVDFGPPPGIDLHAFLGEPRSASISEPSLR